VLDGEPDDLRQPGFVHSPRQPAEADPAGPHLGLHTVRSDCLDVSVKMVDGGDAGLDRAHQSHVGRDVSGPGEADRVRHLHHVVPGLPRHPRVDLLQVVSGVGVGSHKPLGVFGRRGRAAVDRRRADVEVRPEHFAAFDLARERDLVVRSEHAADGGDSVGDVQEEDVLHLVAGRVGAGGDVCVHLGEPRHQKPAGTVDHGGAAGRLDFVRRSDRCDHAVTDDHGPAGQHCIRGHGQDGHAGEHRRAGIVLSLGGCDAGERGDCREQPRDQLRAGGSSLAFSRGRTSKTIHVSHPLPKCPGQGAAASPLSSE